MTTLHKYTPGPWVCVVDATQASPGIITETVMVGTPPPQNEGFVLDEAICTQIYPTASQDNTRRAGELFTEMQIRLAIANGRLIAEAPEMHRLLIYAQAYLERVAHVTALTELDLSDPDLLHDIRQALKRIVGEEAD